jgi:hypothetical protein
MAKASRTRKVIAGFAATAVGMTGASLAERGPSASAETAITSRNQFDGGVVLDFSCDVIPGGQTGTLNIETPGLAQQYPGYYPAGNLLFQTVDVVYPSENIIENMYDDSDKVGLQGSVSTRLRYDIDGRPTRGHISHLTISGPDIATGIVRTLEVNLVGSFQECDTLNPGGRAQTLSARYLYDSAGNFVGKPVETPKAINYGTLALIDPIRALDTRSNNMAPQAGSTTDVLIAGLYGIAPSATAVLVNITALNNGSTRTRSADGFISDGGETSYVNMSGGQARFGEANPNTVIMPLVNGRLQLRSQNGGDFILDVSGYVGSVDENLKVSEGRIVPVDPSRLFDTRNTGTRFTSGETRFIDINPASLGMNLNEVDGVIINLVGVGATESGYVTAWGTGSRPTASSLNYFVANGQRDTRANTIFVKLVKQGDRYGFYLYSDKPIDLLGDIAGVITNTNSPAATDGKLVTGSGVTKRLFDLPQGIPNDRMELTVPRIGNAQRLCAAAIINLTSDSVKQDGFLSVNPAGGLNVSTTNYAKGSTRAHSAVVKLIDGKSIVVSLPGTGNDTRAIADEVACII